MLVDKLFFTNVICDSYKNECEFYIENVVIQNFTFLT